MKKNELQENFGIHGILSADKDPEWIKPHLSGLHEDGCFALWQVRDAMAQIEGMDLKDFKPEVAQKKRDAKAIEAKKMVLSFLKKHIEKAQENKNAMYNKILRVTEPSVPSDPVKAMLHEMRNAEIRANLKSIEPKHRPAAIAGSLERIQAVLGNPDPGDNLITPESLVEIRREFAFQKEPKLVLEEKEAAAIYKAVRARAGEINGTATKMLIGKKMNVDLDPRQHFEVFPPIGEYEGALAERMVQNFDREQEKQTRKEKMSTFGFEAAGNDK